MTGLSTSAIQRRIDQQCKVGLARARLAKAEAQASGAVKYEGQTCMRCESNIRYSQTGNCVECTFHREGMRRELKRALSATALASCKARTAAPTQPARR